MKFVATLAAAAAFAIPSAVAAQDAPVTQEAPAPTISVSDTELTEFVTVAIETQAIRSNTDMAEADKQAAMLAIINASSITPARFTAIVEAIPNDPALQQRVQVEVAEQMAQRQTR
ncbi:DUF4168 domain-containing protein [Erythrobacter sp. EC-HK427]|uniref:DUF4168 domain-containing protein n=1 Tax=Erythrobacter sp. EC-HK427 TaxID=2038396 RepID=UPI0012556959|nr:DUF4168 domain-containing protein [Erythrobacter sp. EC-HK427]VVT12118.1 conserved exported hypothetical protein [Erythrobacter sp. EC-HK427]